MLYILKGLYYKYQADKYSKLVAKCTELRAKIKGKQANYADKADKYQAKYKAH